MSETEKAHYLETTTDQGNKRSEIANFDVTRICLLISVPGLIFDLCTNLGAIPIQDMGS